MYSLVIRLAILAVRAEILEILIPALGFNIANVLEVIDETDPIKI